MFKESLNNFIDSLISFMKFQAMLQPFKAFQISLSNFTKLQEIPIIFALLEQCLGNFKFMLGKVYPAVGPFCAVVNYVFKKL